MSRLVEDVRPSTVRLVAEITRRVHAEGGTCLHCADDGCRQDTWAREVLGVYTTTNLENGRG